MFPRHDEAAEAVAAAAGATTMADMTGMDGMDTMNGTAGSSSSMMNMMAVFQTSTATPLYSMTWTPNSVGTYAATCIFLIALAVLFRTLLAGKAWQESRWLDAEMKRRYVVVNGKLPMHETMSRDSLAKNMVLSENGIEENVMVVRKNTMGKRPWRFTVDPVRALLDTIIVGVGYMLMLAVMTMNVGYFLSILGGTFLGSMLIGRYAVSTEH